MKHMPIIFLLSRATQLRAYGASEKKTRETRIGSESSIMVGKKTRSHLPDMERSDVEMRNAVLRAIVTASPQIRRPRNEDDDKSFRLPPSWIEYFLFAKLAVLGDRWKFKGHPRRPSIIISIVGPRDAYSSEPFRTCDHCISCYLVVP